MNVSINNDCTGCGLCESINNDVFTVHNGKAHANNYRVLGNEQDCQIAANQCPANAIEIS